MREPKYKMTNFIAFREHKNNYRPNEKKKQMFLYYNFPVANMQKVVGIVFR